MGSWCAMLLTLSLVLLLCSDAEACNCSNIGSVVKDAIENVTPREIGLGYVVAIVVSLLLGVVIGVVGTVAACKFTKWMEGKWLIFSPMPRVQSSDIEESALQNPTYELGAATPSSAQQALTHKNSHAQEVYEAIDEPVNQAEALEPVEQFGLLPYAIHDFTEDSKAGVNAVAGKGSPAVAAKGNISRPKKGKKDQIVRRSMSESGSAKPIKPPIAQKATALKKPGMKPVPRTQSTSVSAAPSQAAYSELDKKASYATLEPHIASQEAPMTAEQMSKESYCHLNH